MPLFQFDVSFNNRDWSEDYAGYELKDAKEARSEAFDLMLGVMQERLLSFTQISVRVRDGEPEPVSTLRLSLQIKNRSAMPPG